MNDRIGRRHRLLPAALLALALQVPTTAHAGCAIKTLELPVKIVDRRAIAMVGINGTQVPLIVDSGAFFSFLTEAVAVQLKLPREVLPMGMRVQGLTGQVDAHATTVDHLQMLNGDLPKVEFVVGGNQMNAGAVGLLGRNILTVADTEYDLAHGVIRFVVPSDECETTNMAYWADTQPVSTLTLIRKYREKLPSIRAMVELNGHRKLAVFDSGSPVTTVTLHAAHDVGVKDGDMKPSGKILGAGSGRATAWMAPFDRVAIGDEAVLHNQLEVADLDMGQEEMLIGFDFFLSHRIYVSKKRALMFFTYNGGPVFASNVSSPAAPAAAASGAADDMTADALARRGSASQARGDLAAALADLDRACAMEPGNAGFFATRASVHAALKDFDKTLADLDTALRLDPGLADARMKRAWMRMGRHERAQALADLEVLDTTLPPQANLRGEMARLYGALEMPAQVLAQWNDWIAAHPHDVDLERAYNGRCWARAELGIELDKAMDDCDEAVDADSKNASYLDSRGWVYLRQGKPQKAIADFDRSLAVRPVGAWPLYGRGLARLRLAQTTDGEKDLAAARAADRDIDAKVGRSGLPQAPSGAAASASSVAP